MLLPSWQRPPPSPASSLAPQALGLPDEVMIGGIRLPNLEAGHLRLERVALSQADQPPRLEASYAARCAVQPARRRTVASAAALVCASELPAIVRGRDRICPRKMLPERHCRTKARHFRHMLDGAVACLEQTLGRCKALA